MLIAGTPFSGIGNLDPKSLVFWVAVISLFLGFIALARALQLLMDLLRPDLSYGEILSHNFKIETVLKEHQAEVNHVIAEFRARENVLLPPNAVNLKTLEIKLKAAEAVYRAEMEKDQYKIGQVARTESARMALIEWTDVKTGINQWTAFTRMHFRYSKGISTALRLGFVALALVAIFAIAIGAKEKPATPFVIVTGDPKPPAPEPLPPEIEAILFKTGKWDLSTDAIRLIATARDYLRAKPETGVLVYSYTDTRGDAGTNRRLADKRANSVAQALILEGGIHPSRIFVTGLPETDLPKFTQQEMEKDMNRAVKLVLIAVPARR